MNLKYYLRGLGLGIIVTAVFLGLTLGNAKKMSDEEVKARAKELGMIENTVLSEYGDSNETEQQNEADQEPAQTPVDSSTENTAVEPQFPPAEENQEEQKEEPKRAAEKETADVQPEPETVAEAEAVPQPEGTELSFAVQKGDDSHTVSKKLEEAGMIASAGEFDQYLVENGFDKKIVTGNYSIPADADFDTIVNIIIRR